MENDARIAAFTLAVGKDFVRTSGYSFESSTSQAFVSQVDPAILLNLIVTPIVKEIIAYISERLSSRKQDGPPELAESEIQEIRGLVLKFGSRTGESALVTPELAGRMADSIERVLRQNPEILLHGNKKA